MDWENILVSVLISIIPAVVVAFLTVRLSIKQFYSQKWWEKKAETYSAISGAFAGLLFCTKELADLIEGKTKADQHRRDTLGRKCRECSDLLKQVVAEGSYIISKEAYGVIEDVINKLPEKTDTEVKDIIKNYYNYAKNCKDHFDELAKKDLKIK